MERLNAIARHEPHDAGKHIFRLEDQSDASVERVFDTPEKSDAILDDFIAWKRASRTDAPYGLYDYAPLSPAETNRFVSGDESLQKLVQEAERREFCLKASLSPLNPLFIQTILEQEKELQETKRVAVSPNVQKRVFAISLRMERLKNRMEHNDDFARGLSARLGIEPGRNAEQIADAARDAIRKQVFAFAKKHTGFAMSTSNWHITGALYNDSASVITELKTSIRAWAKLLYSDAIPEPALLAKDILCAFAPYENQQAHYAMLGATKQGEYIVAQQLATNNLINQTNNALNYQAISDAIEQAKLSEEPKTITPLLIVHRPNDDDSIPEGFVRVLNPKKRSVFVIRPLSIERSDKDPDPVYPPQWNEAVSVAKMRDLQRYRLDSFVSPKKLEQYLLGKPQGEGIGTLLVENAILLDAEMDGSASMPDVTGYSLMSQILAKDCAIDASEIFLPLMQTLTRIGIAMDAWVDEYAGDSIRLIFTDPEGQTPNPSEKNALFSIAAHQAQQRFDQTVIATLEADKHDPDVAAFLRAWQSKDLAAMRSCVNAAKKSKDRKLAMAFAYGREYIRITYGNDKYGMKTVSAQSSCAFHYQGIDTAAVSHGKEILSAPSFDKERTDLERIAHEPGQWLVINKAIYDGINMPWMKKLCSPAENAYSIDAVKAHTDPHVIAYFSSIGEQGLFA